MSDAAEKVVIGFFRLPTKGERTDVLQALAGRVAAPPERREELEKQYLRAAAPPQK